MPPKPAIDHSLLRHVGADGHSPCPVKAEPCRQPPSAEPAAPADEALMAQLAHGEDAALTALMARWEIPLKSFLLRLGIPSADLDDIAQEAFVRLYQKRSAYRIGARFKPWLLTLAANLGRNRLRWRLRRREDSIDVLATTTDTRALQPRQSPSPRLRAESLADLSAPPASLQAELNERYSAVRQAVQTLPGKLRQAVVCVDIEDLSYAEAAAVLGCTVKAIESRLQRGRQILRVRCAAFLTRD